MSNFLLMLKQDKKSLFTGFLCFVFFALFLIEKKSYSLVMLGMVIFSLWTFQSWWKSEKDPDVKKLAWYFLVLAIVWGHSFDGLFSWSNEGDLLARYGLGALLLLPFARAGVGYKFLFRGVACGAIFSGIYALIQFPELGRAEGFTNAIRFGNIALLMSVFLVIYAISLKKITAESLFCIFAAIMGLTASLLSLSRGGWIFLFLMPFILIFMFEGKKMRMKALASFVGLGVFAVLILSQVDFFQHRVLLAKQEVQGYFHDKEKYVETSVGARLEQWQLAWKLGMEKPVFGWGERGIQEGRKQMVEHGEAHASALTIPHAHHDFLEMWAVRGFVGMVFLIFIYMVPFCIFFPNQKKISAVPEEKRSIARALYMSGMCIPLAYFVFGLTDVFFNLTIGHVFMIFSIIFIMSAIQGIKNAES